MKWLFCVAQDRMEQQCLSPRTDIHDDRYDHTKPHNSLCSYEDNYGSVSVRMGVVSDVSTSHTTVCAFKLRARPNNNSSNLLCKSNGQLQWINSDCVHEIDDANEGVNAKGVRERQSVVICDSVDYKTKVLHGYLVYNPGVAILSLKQVLSYPRGDIALIHSAPSQITTHPFSVVNTHASMNVRMRFCLRYCDNSSYLHP